MTGELPYDKNSGGRCQMKYTQVHMYWVQLMSSYLNAVTQQFIKHKHGLNMRESSDLIK